MSTLEFRPDHLDINVFAKAHGSLSGEVPLTRMPRLFDCLHADETPGTGETLVTWSAQGRTSQPQGGAFEIWVDVRAHADVPLTCQICLEAVQADLTVDRGFRFVANEALAAQLDEEAEEDVLVSSRNFDLLALIEDELLLALPLVPQHEVCPVRLPVEKGQDTLVALAESSAGSAEEPHPFAALQALKKPPH